MKTSIKIGLSLGMLLLLATAAGQAVNSDSWAATDALGRKVREYKDAGDKKKVRRDLLSDLAHGS